MDEALNTWFAREVLPHEAALVRYLLRLWPNRDEVNDLRQEIYARVYESARKARPLLARPFLFAAARHLIADRTRRGRIVSIEAFGDSDWSNELVDEVTPERDLRAREELKLIARAFRRLPEKCREVVWLRRVDELSQKDVAQKLGISERTVESHLMKGMQVVADTLFANGANHEPAERRRVKPHEPDHGKQ